MRSPTHWTFLSPENPRYVYRLLRAVWILGFRNGFRYWSVENDCISNPSIATYWAERCELEAQKLQRDGDYGEAYVMAAWAKDLRTSHELYMQQKE